MTPWITGVADTHVSPDSRWVPIELAVKALLRAVDDAAASPLRILVHFGDLTDKSLVGGAVLDALAEFFEYARARGVQVFVCEGNHGIDRHNASVIAHLGRYKLSHVRVFAYEAETLTLSNGFRLTFLPFGVPWSKAAELPASLGLFVGHGDIHGASYGTSGEAVTGYTKDELQFFRKAGMAVGLGHIHKPQTLWGDPSMFIPGANLQFRADSVGQERGFIRLDTETLKVSIFQQVGGAWPLFVDWAPSSADEEPPDTSAHEYAYVRALLPPNWKGPEREKLRKMILDAGARGADVQGGEDVYVPKGVEAIPLEASIEEIHDRWLNSEIKDPVRRARMKRLIAPVLEEVRR